MYPITRTVRVRVRADAHVRAMGTGNICALRVYVHYYYISIILCYYYIILYIILYYILRA